MAFKSKTQPLCRFCGKPIKKATVIVYFDRDFGSMSRMVKGVRPKTQAEAQRHVNETIVAVRWNRPKTIKASEMTHRDQEIEPRWIEQAYVWDGETYEDELFCNGDHARQFGYAAAGWESGRLAMPAYNQAMAVRRALKVAK